MHFARGVERHFGLVAAIGLEFGVREAGAVREVVDGNEMSLLGDFDVAEHRVLR